MSIGSAVLVGWYFNVQWIIAFLGSGTTMKANSAVAFALIGVSLLLTQNGRTRLGKGLAWAVVLIAILTLAEHALGVDLGIDELLFRDSNPIETFRPGLMSPVTAASLLLIAFAVLLLHRGKDLAVQAVSAVVVTIALLAVLGHVYDVHELRRIGPYTSVALNTALALLFSAVSILFTHPDRAVMGLIHSSTSAGIMARKLLPAAIVIPAVLGLLTLTGLRREFYDTQFGFAVMVMATIVCLVTLILWSARSLQELHSRHHLLEDQLRQAQKMEAIGQLAGGIAHDFNNLLTVMIGHAEVVLDQLRPNHVVLASVEAIQQAARRATALTRQLLVFSKQRVLPLTTVAVNDVIEEIHSFLERIIGEHVRLELRLMPSAWAIFADRAQLDQVVTNLAVNARDAMPMGGTLLIETDNVTLTKDFVGRHLGSRTGPHVMLAVSDTGSGMDEQTLAHIFEPFFTTKAPGKGTGLGLATVYGIVKQANGSIWVYSEVGKGTTFKLYFPRADVAGPRSEPTPLPAPARVGSLTILVAEDDEMLRKLACDVLRGGGHTVLAATTGDKAVTIADQFPGHIDLLLTDVVMPGRNGQALFEHLITTRTDLRVIFMSGYTDQAIRIQAPLAAAAPFLQKPFTPTDLLRKISEVFADRRNAM